MSYLLPGGFVRFGGADGQLVRPAVHVGVVPLVVLPKSVDHGLGLLRGGRAVKVRQRLPGVCLLNISTNTFNI